MSNGLPIIGIEAEGTWSALEELTWTTSSDRSAAILRAITPDYSPLKIRMASDAAFDGIRFLYIDTLGMVLFCSFDTAVEWEKLTKWEAKWKAKA
mgnify:CR=1 FL=1